jgi:hypothetical protein
MYQQHQQSQQQKEKGDRGKLDIECFLNMIKRCKIEQDILSHTQSILHTRKV